MVQRLEGVSYLKDTIIKESMATSTAALTPTNQIVDGLALWEAEGAENATASLSLIRLDQNDRLLVPFTTMIMPTVLHFLEFPALRGYMRCNGPNCLLCRVGRKPDKRDLWPVYDLLDRAVAVLPISPNQRPHALLPLVVPVWRRLAAGEGPLLFTLRKCDYGFSGSTLPLPQGAEDGAAAIRAFRERFDAGHIDLAAPFPQLANENLAAIAEIKILMAAKGIAI
jgi:hypothetical protein